MFLLVFLSFKLKCILLCRPSRTLHGTETSTRRKLSRSYLRGLTSKAKVKDDTEPTIDINLHHQTCKNLQHMLGPTGEMTLEEFIEGAKDHEDIMDMLKKIMDLTPVLVIIVKGRTGWKPRPHKDYRHILFTISTVRIITSWNPIKRKTDLRQIWKSLESLSLQQNKLPWKPKDIRTSTENKTVRDVARFATLKLLDAMIMWVQNAYVRQICFTSFQKSCLKYTF